LAPPAAKQEDDQLAVLIMQALDEPTDLNVQDAPIGEAIQKLAEQTGIPIEIAPGTFDLLPYGSRTKLTAEIEQQPLRASLAALLEPLGLEFRPDHQRLLIAPSPPLKRIVQRATWEELDQIKRLRTTPWSKEEGEALQFQFQDVPEGDHEANRAELLELAAGVGRGTIAEVLTYATNQRGWTWYPAGDHIVVLTKEHQVERQLETIVAVNYVQTSLTEALLDLAGRAGVPLLIEPGALASLPPQTAERFSLAIRNLTVREALEIVSGQTGLKPVVEAEGIRMTMGNRPVTNTSTQTASSVDPIKLLRTNPIVGQVTVTNPDGSSFSFFIREDDLPPEVNELRKAKIQAEVNKIRRSLMAEQPQD
jgi:hypothetical protein